MKVLGLSGSLRAESHNLRLLRAAAEGLPSGWELEVWDRLAEVPPFNEDDEDAAPEPVRALNDAIREADAVLVATPEYNASLPGVLKNALDWVSRPYDATPLRGKPVAVIGASTGLFGAVWAQAEARKVLRTIGAHVLDDELPVGIAHEAFDEQGRLRDPELTARLHDVVSSLVREVGTPVEQAA
jgi:chromate reductase, NAD(P)H dehydrogenase (quinone)